MRARKVVQPHVRLGGAKGGQMRHTTLSDKRIVAARTFRTHNLEIAKEEPQGGKEETLVKIVIFP